jgi:phosphoglucosamine mutase
MFESALEAGLVAAGVDVKLLGPMPTPAVALMTRTPERRCGYRHQRLAQSLLRQRHQVLLRRWRQAAGRGRAGHRGGAGAAAGNGAVARHRQGQCGSSMPRPLHRVLQVDGARGFQPAGPASIAVDCAHGATYHIAPSVLVANSAPRSSRSASRPTASISTTASVPRTWRRWRDGARAGRRPRHRLRR